jgi:F0F1-type ATP synthase delta subunit
MSEEIKNEEVNIDEKIKELLNDPLIKTEEEREFVNNIAESLKKGDVPVDLILNKSNEALSKLKDLTNLHPEFDSFVKHYESKINEAMAEMTKQLSNTQFK